MMGLATSLSLALALILGVPAPAGAQQASTAPAAGQPWRFLVSGDSRNCGNVVMPAIAVTAKTTQAAFYWHLGDLRYAMDYDEDMVNAPEYKARPMSNLSYLQAAWPDFIEHQIKPFGTLPFYVGIGNHEIIYPRTRADFIQQFADWLVTPQLREQRMKDDPTDFMAKTYYRWIQGGVAFYNLDNAGADMFDARQLRWLQVRLEKDMADASVKSIVIGVHAALPDSLAIDHSMSDFPQGVESGRAVYRMLLKARDVGKKNVYVLASHLHLYMAGVYNSAYWRANGGVLPGWIAGSAGAHRVKLPAGAAEATEAKSPTYGSILGTVKPDGSIAFEYKEVVEADVPVEVVTRYGRDFVHYCFAENVDK